MRKILAGALVWLVALAVVVAPVEAVGAPLAVAVDEMDIEVSNFNFGWVTNKVFARANTGWNYTYGWRAGIETGNASVGATVGNGMNSNTTSGSIADAELGPMAVNFGYGGYNYDAEGSTECYGGCLPKKCLSMPCWMKMAVGYWLWTGNPVAIAWDNTEIEVKNVNFGFVSNDLMLLANTGHNLTVGSKVDTGDAAVTVNVGTTLNTNTTRLEMYESGMGPVAVNFAMGDVYRVPLAVAAESDEISVSNFNFGMVGNNVLARANTGWNGTYGKGKDVDTGDAAVTSNISNAVNTNTTSVAKTDTAVGPVAVNAELSGCGGLSGVPCLPAGGVGPVAANIGTSGIAVAVESDEVEVSNKNGAIVTNNETLVANTGHNQTGCELSPCPPKPCEIGCESEAGAEAVTTTVDTGNASVTTTVTNTVNSNSTTITVGEGTPMLP